MAASQSQRAALYSNLVEALGEEAADTLMNELPPGGWENLATKDDVRLAEERLEHALTKSSAELRGALAELARAQAVTSKSLSEFKEATSKSLEKSARSESRHFYVMLTTLVLFAVGTWITLFLTVGT